VGWERRLGTRERVRRLGGGRGGLGERDDGRWVGGEVKVGEEGGG